MKKSLWIAGLIAFLALLVSGCGGGGGTGTAQNSPDGDPPVGTWEVKSPLTFVPSGATINSGTDQFTAGSMRINLNSSAVYTYNGQLYTPCILVSMWDEGTQLLFGGSFSWSAGTISASHLVGPSGTARITGTIGADQTLHGTIELTRASGKWYYADFSATVPGEPIRNPY